MLQRIIHSQEQTDGKASADHFYSQEQTDAIASVDHSSGEDTFHASFPRTKRLHTGHTERSREVSE